MTWKAAAVATLVMAVAAVVLIVSASRIYCGWIGRVDLFVFPWDQWVTLLPWWSASFWMKMYIVGSAAPAVLLILIIGSTEYGRWRSRSRRRLTSSASGELRQIEPAKTDNHGHGRFQTIEEAQELFPGPHPVWGGVVVGEAAIVEKSWGRRFKPHDKSTWGDGGKAPLLIDPCDDGAGHFILFSGSGWYKTSCLIPTILEWKTGCVVLDEAAEVGAMVKDALEVDHGKTIHFLNPVRPDDEERWGFDAVDWVIPASATFEEDVHSVVAWIYGKPDKEDPFFDPWARDMIACLLADMLTADEASMKVKGRKKKASLAPKNLATLRRGIVTPEASMRALLRGIHHNSNSPLARDIAGGLMDATEKQFSGIYGTAFKATSWLSTPSLADLVSGDAFKTGDIAQGNIAVFIQIPADTLSFSPGVARVIVGALAKAVVRAAKSQALVGKTLMLLDEVRLLRHMQVIEDIRDLGRKSGLVLGLTYQTVGLLTEQWGPAGKEKWYSTVSWRGYCSVRDVKTAEELAKECGQSGVMAYSEGDNTGSSGRVMALMNSQRSHGHNTNIHEISHPVAFLHEILSESRTDEMWVAGTGYWVLRCSRAIYWRRPEFVAKVEVSKYVHIISEDEEAA